MRAKAKPKKVRRVVLGVGHPWFSEVSAAGSWQSVRLTKTAVHPSILLRSFDWQNIKAGGLGNWNKIRLVAEVLE